MSGRCEIHAAMGYDLIVFQMAKHVLTDDVFYSLATHTGQRYWTVVTGHVFVAFLENTAYICISPVIWKCASIKTLLKKC